MKFNLNKNTILALAFALTSLTLTACSNSSANADHENARAVQIPIGSEEPPMEKNTAPKEFAFLDGNGKSVTLNDLKGKVVFINFWATWCPPCLQEMPSIHKLKQTFKGEDIVFLLVDVDNQYEQANAFMKKNNYDLPVYVANGPIPSEFVGRGIPTTVVLDRSGTMLAKIEGGRDYAAPEMLQTFKDIITKN